MEFISRAVLLTFLGIGAWMDIVHQRISNVFIAFGFGLAAFYQIFLKHDRMCIPGMLLPLLILGILFVFHALGAGDIKLLMVSGMFLGPEAVFQCIMISILVAAVLSMYKLLRHRILVVRLQYFVTYFRDFLQTGECKPYYDKEQGQDCVIPFAVPVFIGTILYYVWEGCV